MKKKKIVILGSTGSIGVNTLKVIKKFPELFEVLGLSAYSNTELLARQIRDFSPKYVALPECQHKKIKKQGSLLKGLKILNVGADLEYLVGLKEVDTVVIAMRGSAALLPFLSAVKSGKRVAPANKEALVVAGEILMREAKKSGAEIIPIDSEQSAIFQCLEGYKKSDVRTVHLTASGGALLNIPESRFDKLSVDFILNHPRWKMGQKITVDSATLMNKGFEIIEALRLFSLDISQVKVIIHPEAVVHSMVEYHDGSIMAQLGITDMRLPIQYALTYPKRLNTNWPRLDFAELKALTFLDPDYKKFPALMLAINAAKKGGTCPAVLNAADEEAVEAFLQKKIKFTQIFEVVEKVTRKHKIQASPTIKQILDADLWAREEAKKVILN